MGAQIVSLDQLCINTIRALSIDAIQKANSGHPGLPLGAAPMAHVLWQQHLKQAASHPRWPDRDRFVLSAGHGSMLLYSLLHLHGFDLSLDEIKNFRQWQSKTPGHPEAFLTAGVEATTGPPGQGSANAVGMAVAERALASHFNRPEHTVVDHFTYALVSDGDLMEGVSAEAGSLAGHLKLGKLIYLYDANDISLDGPLDITFTEDVGKRYESYGWQVITVENGDEDLKAIDQAIVDAKADTGRPTLIIIKTTIGFGSPNKAGTSKVHGSPLGVDEVAATKKNLGWESTEDFFIPQEAKAHFAQACEHGKQAYAQWQKRFDAYSKAFPDLAKQWEQAQAGNLPQAWDSEVPTWSPGDKLATRVAGGLVMNAIAKHVPTFLGGDADLSCSTMTLLKDMGSFEGQSGRGRNIHFGVREHAMGSIANGMAYHGGLRTFTATFFCFADYMRPAIRLAALNHLPVTFIFTHDSIGLGEDGPTHQAVEHLASLRCMPNVRVVRPCDANETAEAWKMAMQHTTGPTVLVFSRQKLEVLARNEQAGSECLQRGGYVLAPDNGDPKAILLASGSEIGPCLQAHKALNDAGISTRLVSMPCWEAFEDQPAEYRNEILPPAVRVRVAVEAGASMGWERYVGLEGTVIGVDKYGASAPADIVFENYGFSSENIAQKVREQL